MIAQTRAAEYPVRLVCPACRAGLQIGETQLICNACRQVFRFENGIPDLIVGGRFEDEDDRDRTNYEEQSNAFTTENYMLPLFQRLFAGRSRARLLSLGCGSGMDVDRLTEAGFDIVGIDCGSRSAVWPHRQQKDRLYLANGKHLPFEDQTFDAVYCGCVFPHVGVEGDSNRVRPDYFEERLAIAKEMGRVLRPGGHVFVSSPNRLFPLDLFHGRTPEKPLPRLNLPSNPFLLSFSDYRTLFGRAGCSEFKLLPVTNYWGFIRKKTSLKGRLIAFPVQSLFEIVSTDRFQSLRGSPVSPWLSVLMSKAT